MIRFPREWLNKYATFVSVVTQTVKKADTARHKGYGAFSVHQFGFRIPLVYKEISKISTFISENTGGRVWMGYTLPQKGFKSRQNMTKKISHVLVCRTDNIGDAILTLPLTAYIKQRFPSVKISFLCRAYTAEVIRYCSTVDEVIEVESLTDPAAFFSQSGIDIVIFVQQPDKHLAVAAHKAKIAVRIGDAHRWFNWIHCNRPVYFSRRRSDYHEAQLNFHYLRPMGINFVPDRATIPAMYQLKIPRDLALDQMLQGYRFNLIIHPKSNGHGREWPSNHFVTLAKSLNKEKNIHLWVTGSAAEGEWLNQHSPELFQLPNVSNLCGKFTLPQLASFIQAADGLIASGTGPLHLSAAIGQRTIGLFPPTARPMHSRRWGALGTRAQSLSQPTNCSNCKVKHAITCDCMTNISPEMVEEIVLQWSAQKEKNDRHAKPDIGSYESVGAEEIEAKKC